MQDGWFGPGQCLPAIFDQPELNVAYMIDFASSLFKWLT